MANAMNIEGTLLFEQPFARVPYENYRKVFRATQRALEKELQHVQAAAADLARRADSPQSSSANLAAVEGMIAKVEGLKRKLADLHESAGKPTLAVLRARLTHLDLLPSPGTTPDPAALDRWADTRLERWLVDWALRTGKPRTAAALARERGIGHLVDIELFTDVHRVERALAGESCVEALAWCAENKNALKKMKSTLEFSLRLQEYIELARARRTSAAIAYSRRYLVQWQDTHLAEIKTASGLLAFKPGTRCGPYKRLYDPARWPALVASFRRAAYALHALPSEPLLHLALYAGLASLRLPACRVPANLLPAAEASTNMDIVTEVPPPQRASPSSTASSDSGEHDGGDPMDESEPAEVHQLHQIGNNDCPTCDPSLAVLAQEVPFSHHVNSTIVCAASGRIMDADNGPLCFPSGNVYCREILEEIALQNGGIVKDPRTGHTCAFGDLRKVFIS
ncbi:hypothetical protein HWV62_16666 [Athelia sp. TMB]|nr:hypothetical protein HWV62_16666 [Athelia sp. TMB]